LRHALKNKEFGIYYQPLVNSAGQVVGAEALLRWMRQDFSIVLPGTFIRAAEESGLIIPIGDWVIDQCCQQLKRWQQDAQTSTLKLSINISVVQFRQVDFAVKLRAAIELHNINPASIVLELTESSLLHRAEDAIARMVELKSYGVLFSLDDFGTGYSSLSYLKLLPLDQVKIDASFVRDISFDSDDNAIVRAILAMCKSLGLNVIAEGVETEAQRDFLFEHGCMYYQGYLFGRPVPIEVFNAEMLTNVS
jgi:EAL domain-containing protein (putative c-di-GMP-specific phosphodiesterase class I)